MTEILFLCPMRGNGGIASWSREYRESFVYDDFSIVPIDIAPPRDFTHYRGFIDRILNGMAVFGRLRKILSQRLTLNDGNSIVHLASGGGLGLVRDLGVARICKKHRVRSILHCHFGCVKESCESKSLIGIIFRKALNSFDQIWVLDKHSYDYLRQRHDWRDKVFLTPNSIDVPDKCDLSPKQYRRVGFIGNLLPTKGIFDLTIAVAEMSNTQLFIAGTGLDEDVSVIKKLAGKQLNKTIHLLGLLPNAEAIRLIDSLDIVCLPTYYSNEAFPISILEAMSLGKMVISCPRAAIPDMLTSSDGTLCGILVPEKSPSSIAEAIAWCQQHLREADEMCRKAYEKVNKTYRKEVVYQIYRNNYLKLVH